MATGHAKAIRDIVERLRQQGFTVEIARNGHYSVQCPDHIVLPPGSRRKIQIPCTPAIERTVKNTVTRLKRIGYRP